ncbi:hypothetical protein SAMN05421504_102467 [Amycolatopsis xylanica]|uniref:Uncharacterized protein n=1 Tax=Amycolatopsis xylanica TaxID=589385 RepID=A0A1H2ZDZ1_9PSEU|nr:hypothetical protein [Amycolatopsis xylanica]SDX15178.1 hypothetical protein SAMN05421504_102467 [Amycolatopsis xylanica]
MKRWGFLLATAFLAGGCAEVNSAVDQANSTADKVSACSEALGLADLNPLVDAEKIKARAADKERRLRELAANVSDQDVKKSLLTMADSYVEVQKERFEDLGVVGRWAKRNAERLDSLRQACT